MGLHTQSQRPTEEEEEDDALPPTRSLFLGSLLWLCDLRSRRGSKERKRWKDGRPRGEYDKDGLKTEHQVNMNDLHDARKIWREWR